MHLLNSGPEMEVGDMRMLDVCEELQFTKLDKIGN